MNIEEFRRKVLTNPNDKKGQLDYRHAMQRSGKNIFTTFEIAVVDSNAISKESMRSLQDHVDNYEHGQCVYLESKQNFQPSYASNDVWNTFYVFIVYVDEDFENDYVISDRAKQEILDILQDAKMQGYLWVAIPVEEEEYHGN